MPVRRVEMGQLDGFEGESGNSVLLAQPAKVMHRRIDVVILFKSAPP